MKCPNCGEDDNGVHKTYSDLNFMMEKNMRTRHCHVCGYFFETEEAAYGTVFSFKEGRKMPKKDEKQRSIFNKKR